MSSNEVSFTVFRGSKSGEIVPVKTTKGPLKDDEVLVSVTASGLCGTDLHYQTTDMGLGHEGVGTVVSTGPNVRDLKKGDRVGWGYYHSTCGTCDQCLKGTDTFCQQAHLYGVTELDQGSLAYGAVWKEEALYVVPDELTDEEAAPLMCGGATVFNALHMHNAKPTDRVGIIGVGGLGHLAIQFASKMGCETVVFSGTDSKKEEALKLGASEFYATKGAKELKPKGGIDVLLVTTAAQPDWSLYQSILNPEAKIFPLTVAEGNFEFPYMPMLMNGITIQGSIVASKHIQRRMLRFAARHGIKPMLNTFSLDKQGIETAIKTLDEGKMRYRGVLVPPKESRL